MRESLNLLDMLYLCYFLSGELFKDGVTECLCLFG